MWQEKLLNWLQSFTVWKRPPDVVIGGYENPYLHRWHVIPRNRFFNIYLHHFMRSDDDRALHDHPWMNCSILLDGEYYEHVPGPNFKNNKNDTIMKWRKPGALYFRKPSQLHRVELFYDFKRKTPYGNYAEEPVWTLFITGPRVRTWGFACPKGWVDWMTFTGEDEKGSSVVGKGCD